MPARVSVRYTRAERLAQINHRRAKGWTQRMIAADLGMSVSGVRSVLYDPNGEKQKARKLGYRGVCVDCGSPTNGSNGRAKAPARCLPCRAAWQASPEGRAVYTHWTRERCIDAIQRWAREHGEPPGLADWNPTHCRDLGDFAREIRATHAVEGDYPWFASVVRRFGSWNAGIEAAGFTPRAPKMTAENYQRTRAARSAA